MVTPLGVLKDTPESNNPTKFEAGRLMDVKLQPIVFSLKDRVNNKLLSLRSRNWFL